MTKRHTLLLLLLFAAFTVLAAPVSQREAHKLATSYLRVALGAKQAASLSLCHTYVDEDGVATVYVYNVSDSGFILVSGDDMVTPVLGYSFNGPFEESRLSPAFSSWLRAQSEGLSAMRRAKYARCPAEVAAERAALLGGDASYYAPKGAKDVPAMLETQWGQGEGYNDLCPAYTGRGNSGGHAVVGCVALAMAQVIRYWAYPDTGFGEHTYYDEPYGTLTAHFDEVRYDYANMPDEYSYWNGTEEQRAALSQLCYHCGVSVNMNYQSVGNEDGSGAQTENIVNGLTHFGYFGAFYQSRTSSADFRHDFDSLVLNDLKKGFPVVCQGYSSEYGHAYVCDGYRASTSKYHFNWGWDGYQDGFYTMDDMNGFTHNQGAVLNIRPSGLDVREGAIHVAADGTGDGTSWQDATPNLQDAIDFSFEFGPFPVWVKEGVYYGDTNGQNAIVMRGGVELLGGFAGTETDEDEANGFLHPTVISGQRKRRAFYCDNFRSTTHVYDMTFADGFAEDGAGAYVQNNVTLFRCTARNNEGTRGVGFFSTGGTFFNGIVATGNKGRDAVLVSETDNLRNSLIVNNDASGVAMTGTGEVLNCDIVGNTGYGILEAASAAVRNSIVCANGMGLLGGVCRKVSFSMTDYKAGQDAMLDSLFLANSNIFADSVEAVRFVNAVIEGAYTKPEADWHLAQGSPCVNAGDTNATGTDRYDLDGNQRKRQGRIDIGCYESAYNGLGIADRPQGSFRVYPNPASSHVTISAPTPVDIAIYNSIGQQVLSAKCAESVTLDIGGLPRGFYVVRGSNGETAKLVK